jgi:hypothetical protein
MRLLPRFIVEWKARRDRDVAAALRLLADRNAVGDFANLRWHLEDVSRETLLFHTADGGHTEALFDRAAQTVRVFVHSDR